MEYRSGSGGGYYIGEYYTLEETIYEVDEDGEEECVEGNGSYEEVFPVFPKANEEEE